MDDVMALATKNEVGAMVEVESARATQEVQAAMVIAKRFPRDQMAAYDRIMKACERPNLAKEAVYAYPKGGQMVTGPSIRLAEVLAQNWGNLEFGIRELSQAHGKSDVLAFAWDLETNTRQVKEFSVPHQRYTKKGTKVLSDPREIYEHMANMGARRMRACILGIIPGDISDAAVAKCEETLEKGDGRPLEDRIRDMLVVFREMGITKGMLEERLGHNLDVTTNVELTNLGKIYRSLKDGMSGREDWFDFEVETRKKADELTEKVKKGKDLSQEDEGPKTPTGRPDLTFLQEEQAKEDASSKKPTQRRRTNLYEINGEKVKTAGIKGPVLAQIMKIEANHVNGPMVVHAYLATLKITDLTYLREDEGKQLLTTLADQVAPKDTGQGDSAPPEGTIINCPINGGRKVHTDVCATNKCGKAEKCDPYKEWQHEEGIGG